MYLYNSWWNKNIIGIEPKVDTSTDIPILINKDVNNYFLEVVNKNTDEVFGRSDATDLTTDGTQIFNLIELSVDINFIEGYKVEDFNLSTLTLTSNRKELKPSFLYLEDKNIKLLI